MSKLYVVGIGPGKVEGMTYEAARALEESDVIVGYTVYVDLVKEHSGDPGVYGMSGLCEELAAKHPGVEVVTVPGVSAVLSGAAILGAPLMHDFAVISLSDLMTPWATIEKRLRAAAAADFVICLYNPSSHKRKDYLARACDIVLEAASPETVCGVAQNIGREGENTRTMTLQALRDAQVDMFSTAFIGNSQTRIIGGRMVTPRGYDHD